MIQLTKKQADALKQALYLRGDAESVMWAHMQHYDLSIKTSSNWGGQLEPLCKLSAQELAQALFVGFEVIATKEEKIREYYEGLNQHQYKKHVVKDILNILEVDIEGVNVQCLKPKQ